MSELNLIVISVLIISAPLITLFIYKNSLGSLERALKKNDLALNEMETKVSSGELLESGELYQKVMAIINSDRQVILGKIQSKKQ